MKKEGGRAANIRSPFCVSRRVCDEDEKGLWPEGQREKVGTKISRNNMKQKDWG